MPPIRTVLVALLAVPATALVAPHLGSAPEVEPVAEVSPAAHCQDDDDDGCTAKKHKKAQRHVHSDHDIDVSTLSDEDVVGLAAVAEALVIAAIAASI